MIANRIVLDFVFPLLAYLCNLFFTLPVNTLAKHEVYQ